MNTRIHPSDIVLDLLKRSTCRVKVAAVLADRRGVFAWGHNHVGEGFGQHAEAHCLSRANPTRLADASIWVAAEGEQRRKVTARPCEDCQRLLKQVGTIIYRAKDGKWRMQLKEKM